MKPIILLALLSLTTRLIAATGGNPGDVQAAIDSASSGATITLANGTYSWNSSVEVNKFVKIVGNNTTIQNNTGPNAWSAALFWVKPQSAGSVEISGIHFSNSGSVGKHIVVQDGTGQPVIVHDCQFDQSGSGGRSIEWQTNGGLIYNCTFVSTDKNDNSGIAFKNPGSDSAWHEASTLGNKDVDGTKNTYMEDCIFRDVFLQAFDVDDNSRTVIRHNTFDNSGAASHGQDTSPVGVRQWEIYDNEFIFTLGGNCNPNPYPLNLNYWFYCRGGAGVIFDNFFPDISSCAWGNKPNVTLTVYSIRRHSNAIPCQTSYPASRQTAFGSDASGRQISDPIYIWGNTGGNNANKVALKNYDPDECGNNMQVTDFLREGRDYFLGQAKPGYTPYQYPHPLRGGKPQPTPTPTPAPTATPTPQPTPTPPQPTPTPPGSTTYRNWLDQLGEWIHSHPATPDR